MNGKVLPQRYPKAGDPNAIPSVHVVDLAGKETASFAPAPDDVYVAPGARLDRGRQAGLLPPPRPPADDARRLPPAAPGRRAEEAPHGEGPRLDQRDRAAPLPRRRDVPVPVRAHGLPASLPPCVGRHARQRRHEGRLDDRRAVVRRREGGLSSGSPPPRRTPASATCTARSWTGRAFAGHPGARLSLPDAVARRRLFREHVLERHDAAEDRRPRGHRAPSSRSSTTRPAPGPTTSSAPSRWAPSEGPTGRSSTRGS